MLVHARGVAQLLNEPGPRGVRVGHGLLGGKGLRRHQKQGAFGVQLLQALVEVGAVDVGHKVEVQGAVGKGF